MSERKRVRSEWKQKSARAEQRAKRVRETYSEILRAYILLRVCVNVSEILLLSFNRNCILVETELPKILRYVLMNTLSPNNSEDECQQVNLFYTIPKIKYCL